MQHVPITLWRHLLLELTKMLVITTGIIVTVIAFGAATKSLIENRIGADQVAKYVALATVPMLQYALPFAAGFAATVVLHRFVTDNEVTAMSASGMSYRRILAPVALLGLPLCILMFLLVAFMAPRIWTKMRDMGAADLTQMMVASVERGEALTLKNLQIYADDVEEVALPPDAAPKRRLILRGVVAVELNKRTGGPVTEFTAEVATVDVYVGEDGTFAKMAMVNATVFRPMDGAIANVPSVEPQPLSLNLEIEQKAKFLELPQLLAVRRDPDRSKLVKDAKADLAATLSAYDVWVCALDQVERTKTLVLEQRGSGRSVRFDGVTLEAGPLDAASKEEAPRLVAAQKGGTFTVTESDAGRPVRTTHATSAHLRAVSEVGFVPSFSAVVVDPQQTRNAVDNLAARWPKRIDDLLPKGCVLRDWSVAPSSELVAAGALIPSGETRLPGRTLSQAAHELTRTVNNRRDSVLWDADSHLVHRAAETVSVGLVLMLGGVLAVYMRRALPLTVYILAFVPAIGNIMMISGGQQTMRDGHLLSGALLMWGGNALLGVVLVWAWTRMARN